MKEIKRIDNNTLPNFYGKVVVGNQGLEPVMCDGMRMIVGYSDEEGQKAAYEMLQEAINNSANPNDLRDKLAKVAQCMANEVVPDEEIEVDDIKVVLSYKDKKTYIVTPVAVETVADLSDLNLPAIGKDALKELLTRETSRVLGERKLAECEEEYSEGCDDDCGGYIGY